MVQLQKYCEGCYAEFADPQPYPEGRWRLCDECAKVAAEPIKRYDSTGDAYDGSNGDARTRTGDTLLVEGECVVGLAWAWPLAVTVEHGALHTVSDEPGATARVLADAKISDEQVRAAVAVARERGWAVRSEFEAI